MRCLHDGRSALPVHWLPARGLRIQRLRADDLGAQLEWQVREPDMIELHLRFSLDNP